MTVGTTIDVYRDARRIVVQLGDEPEENIVTALRSALDIVAGRKLRAVNSEGGRFEIRPDRGKHDA